MNFNDRKTDTLIYRFSSIKDPRVNRQKKHQLKDIFFISLPTMILGAYNWMAIKEFGLAKEEWFTELLDLAHGIPSHDSFGEAYSAIDTHQFSDCFSRRIADLAGLTESLRRRWQPDSERTQCGESGGDSAYCPVPDQN